LIDSTLATEALKNRITRLHIAKKREPKQDKESKQEKEQAVERAHVRLEAPERRGSPYGFPESYRNRQ
jgi:hypothetical protein